MSRQKSNEQSHAVDRTSNDIANDVLSDGPSFMTKQRTALTGRGYKICRHFSAEE